MIARMRTTSHGGNGGRRCRNVLRTPPVRIGIRSSVVAGLVWIVFGATGCAGPPGTGPMLQTGWAAGPANHGDDIPVGPEPAILPVTYFRAGQLHEMRGTLDLALLHYRKATALNPKFVAAHNRAGIVLDRLGRYVEADEAFLKAVEQAPDQAYLRNNLAFSYMLQHRWSDAEAELHNALSLSPTFKRARVNLGVALGRMGRYDEALGQFRQVVPEAAAHYNLGLVYHANDDDDAALDAFAKALSLQPKMDAARQQIEVIVATRRIEVGPTIEKVDDASAELVSAGPELTSQDAANESPADANTTADATVDAAVAAAEPPTPADEVVVEPSDTDATLPTPDENESVEEAPAVMPAEIVIWEPALRDAVRVTRSTLARWHDDFECASWEAGLAFKAWHANIRAPTPPEESAVIIQQNAGEVTVVAEPTEAIAPSESSPTSDTATAETVDTADVAMAEPAPLPAPVVPDPAWVVPWAPEWLDEQDDEASSSETALSDNAESIDEVVPPTPEVTRATSLRILGLARHAVAVEWLAEVERTRIRASEAWIDLVDEALGPVRSPVMAIETDETLTPEDLSVGVDLAPEELQPIERDEVAPTDHPVESDTPDPESTVVDSPAAEPVATEADEAIDSDGPGESIDAVAPSMVADEVSVDENVDTKQPPTNTSDRDAGELTTAGETEGVETHIGRRARLLQIVMMAQSEANRRFRAELDAAEAQIQRFERVVADQEDRIRPDAFAGELETPPVTMQERDVDRAPAAKEGDEIKGDEPGG